MQYECNQASKLSTNKVRKKVNNECIIATWTPSRLLDCPFSKCLGNLEICAILLIKQVIYCFVIFKVIFVEFILLLSLNLVSLDRLVLSHFVGAD